MNQVVNGTKVWLSLYKASRAVEQHARAHVESLGMCLSDFAVLEALLHKGKLPINTLGKKVLLTSGSITTAVDRLVKKELVQRKADPDDGRVALVDLTSQGRTLIEEAFQQHEVALERATAGLTQHQKEQVAVLLKKLGHYAEALK